MSLRFPGWDVWEKFRRRLRRRRVWVPVGWAAR